METGLALPWHSPIGSPNRLAFLGLGLNRLAGYYEPYMSEPGKTQKPTWWKVILGGLLVLAEIGSIFGRAQPLTRNPNEVAGMMEKVALIFVGAWLIHAGTKPLRANKLD